MHRYSSIDYVLNLPANEGMDLIIAARENEHTEKLWQVWLLDTLGMDEKNYIGFDEYKRLDKEKSKQLISTTRKEPIADAEKILKIRRKVGDNNNVSNENI